MSVSERLPVLDLRICSGMTVAIIGECFPHTGCPDVDVEHLYDGIDNAIAESKQRGAHPILAADFNAEVGPVGAAKRRQLLFSELK